MQVHNILKPDVWNAISYKRLELQFPHFMYIPPGVNKCEEY